MKEYEFTSSWGLSKASWLISRPEKERYGKIVRRWKKENPKADELHEMLIESLIRQHIFEQRLVDRRYFFNGEKTDYEKVADHEVDVHSEDLDRKERELLKYMPLVQKWKTDLLKLALANDIKIDVSGDLSELFISVDQEKKSSGNGSDKEEK